jgi:hypothetical protein
MALVQESAYQVAACLLAKEHRDERTIAQRGRSFDPKALTVCFIPAQDLIAGGQQLPDLRFSGGGRQTPAWAGPVDFAAGDVERRRRNRGVLPISGLSWHNPGYEGMGINGCYWLGKYA